jgi:hypothetical protein
MNKLKLIQTLMVAGILGVLPLAARAAVSPHETISSVISGNRVTITYGRPYSKDPKSTEIRKIWGGDKPLVPPGKAWRLGADEATLLITQQPIMIGDLSVPAGAYTLYMVPMENGASKLAVSTAIGGWGIPVDEKHDLGRVDLKKDTVDKQVDQLTLALDRTGLLKITWENAQFSVPITVKK